MKPAEAARLATTALTAYQHIRTVGAMTAKERGATMDLWAIVFADLDYEATNAALLRHIATSEFFPTPAELRRIVAESLNGRRRSGIDVWGDVLREVGRTGRYGSPQFADPIVARVVASIGWRAICDSEDEMVERAHFAKAYDALAIGAAEDATVATLPGVARPALPGSELVASVAKRLTGGAP